MPRAADAAPPSPAGPALDRALPADVQIGGHQVWDRYKRYPVFSRPWLRGRSAMFALVATLFAAATAVGVYVMSRSWASALVSAPLQFAFWMVVTSAGPALAVAVRHRRWPPRRERAAIFAAIALGVVLAFLADAAASKWTVELMGERARQTAAQASAPPPPAWRWLLAALSLALEGLLYALLGGALALYAYLSEASRWQASLERRRYLALDESNRRTELQLGVLQAQVEPHFLFNTLASVRALVRPDPQRAEATLDALVGYLRATIPKLREGEARLDAELGQQLDICASYLEVMRLRTDGRLSHAVQAPAAVRLLPCPPLLLIPLVENAVKHGIEPRSGPGRIELRARRDGDWLELEVADDGVGLRTGVGGGVGLANVRAQLAARFGERATLQLCSRREGGTLARVRLPLERPA